MGVPPRVGDTPSIPPGGSSPEKGDAQLLPDDDTVLAPDDELLFAGQSSERRELESTMVVDSTASYVLFDQHLPSSWLWRKLARTSATQPAAPAAPADADAPDAGVEAGQPK